jgi:Astacin (Peptidase family M12A)
MSSTPIFRVLPGLRMRSEADYVHLARSTVGNGICSSSVGMIGGEQFLHVEDTCTTATPLHEMGHAVGFFHEQSSRTWGVYDYASHMHYTPFEFSANNVPVMQTVPAGIPLDSYSVLSPGDLDTLFRMYGKAPQ